MDLSGHNTSSWRVVPLVPPSSAGPPWQARRTGSPARSSRLADGIDSRSTAKHARQAVGRRCTTQALPLRSHAHVHRAIVHLHRCPNLVTRDASTSSTASVAALGAFAGAVLGGSAGAGLLLVLGGTDRLVSGRGLVVLCAAYGAVVGSVLAPLTRILLLRDVPLHRAARYTFAGAFAGIVAGCFLGPELGYALAWPAGLGLLGFIISALVLRHLASR